MIAGTGVGARQPARGSLRDGTGHRHAGGSGRGLRLWEVDAEGGAPAHLALHQDVAAALPDDAVAAGEAQARAPAAGLGGEERLEQVAERILVHPGSFVGHAHQHVEPGLQVLRGPEIIVVDQDVRGLDGETPAVRHGVPGVEAKVHEDPADLIPVHAYEVEVSRPPHRDLDRLADQPPQETLAVRDHGVQADQLGVEHLPAAEGQELPGEVRGPVGGRAYVGDVAAHPLVAGLARREVGAADDGHDQAVEVVGHAAGQAPDRLHLVRLGELLLELAPPGDVEEGADHPLGTAARVAHDVAAADHARVRAVRAPEAELVLDLVFALAHEALDVRAQPGPILGVDAGVPPLHAGLEVRYGAAEQGLDGLAPPHAARREVQLPDGVAGRARSHLVAGEHLALGDAGALGGEAGGPHGPGQP